MAKFVMEIDSVAKTCKATVDGVPCDDVSMGLYRSMDWAGEMHKYCYATCTMQTNDGGWQSTSYSFEPGQSEDAKAIVSKTVDAHKNIVAPVKQLVASHKLQEALKK